MKNILKVLLLVGMLGLLFSCEVIFTVDDTSSNYITVYNNTGYTIDEIYIVSYSDAVYYSSSPSTLRSMYVDQLSYTLSDGFSRTIYTSNNDGYYVLAVCDNIYNVYSYYDYFYAEEIDYNRDYITLSSDNFDSAILQY